MKRLIAGAALPAALALLFAAQAAQAATEKSEIVVNNDRNEPVTMRFEYAFRNYTWKLVEEPMDAGGSLTYRFPVNIPGCDKLRDWHITDGVLSIHNAKGLVCTKRVSLCDRLTSTMDVQGGACYWRDR
jgi:hypothetical protein